VCRFDELVAFWGERLSELQEWMKLVIRMCEERNEDVTVEIEVCQGWVSVC
jgi:hypothetical protein